MKSICNFISRYLGVIVLVMAVVALLMPGSFMWVDPLYINPLLGVVMFGMGLTLNPADFKIVFSRPKDVIIGCLAQFIVMPILAWLFAKVFHLSPELALGVILVGCSLGGTASNVITYLAKGDLALSVGMTATSTVLAPFLTPLITWMMAGTFVHVDAQSMFFSIVQVVMLHNICGLLLGFSIGKLLRLEYKKCVAISIEVGMQSSGLASSLATLHFAAYPLATIPGAIFSVWHNICGTLMARLYSSRHQGDR